MVIVTVGFQVSLARLAARLSQLQVEPVEVMVQCKLKCVSMPVMPSLRYL